MSDKIMRVDKTFADEINEIIGERIAIRKDRFDTRKSANRITAGITKHPLWRDKIKKDLIMADMPKLEKRR